MAYSLSPLLKPRFFVNATNKPLVGAVAVDVRVAGRDGREGAGW